MEPKTSLLWGGSWGQLHPPATMPTAVVARISGTRGWPVSVSGLGILAQLVVAPAAYGGGVVVVRDRLSLYRSHRQS
jgi:hypothetical protein